MDSKYSVKRPGAAGGWSTLKRKFSYGSYATPNGQPSKRPNIQTPTKNGYKNGTNGTTNGKQTTNAFHILEQRKILPVFAVRTE